ncbi:MAG: hypothetical protein PUC05_03120 [Firmicutes bacterium]|nr:hypothetical protein [Bacillota bacterium]
MYGSFWGTVAALLYLAAFIAGGWFIADRVFYKERLLFRVVTGAVMGSFALQWLPAVFALVMGFNLWAHLAALALLAVILAVIYKLCPQRGGFGIRQLRISYPGLAVSVLITAVFVYFWVTLSTHTILVAQDGAIHTGQCTYGDMNMHLGFITSVAKQGMFPPDYSILPGTKLCYPFLCDTISSSLYIFGCSLRFAYMAPMLLAAAELFAGFYLFADTWLKDRSKSVLAWVLFFFCGGFGFIYFMDAWRDNPDNFLRIFSQYYQTPTNLVSEGNIRWVNIIVDMLLPQRATLFGWAVLFPTLTVLYKAVFENQKRYFIIGGILAGGLPMIHTHSFLACGLICACWLLYTLVSGIKAGEPEGKKSGVLYAAIIAAAVLTLTGFAALLPSLLSEGDVPSLAVAMPAIGIVAGLLAAGIILLSAYIKRGLGRGLLTGWLPFLLIVLALALPQLLTWTFAQVGQGTMLKGHFNWANINDSYVWFYVKNIGVAALLAIPAFIGGKKLFKTAAPALLIFAICEFVVFQPNVYDNNKLLYVSYALAVCVVASYMVDIYRAMAKNKIGGRVIIAGITVFACVFSAVLTMGREVVSDYVLYDSNQVAAAEFIEENTPTDACILTGTRHNNAVSSLTGRNIVCGSGTFLYYHGVGYQQREADVKYMYNNIGSAEEMLEKYGVDYIFVSSYERGAYSIDEQKLGEIYKCVYSGGDVKIYAVSPRAEQNV